MRRIITLFAITIIAFTLIVIVAQSLRGKNTDSNNTKTQHEATSKIDPRVKKYLESMSLRQKIASLFVIHGDGSLARTVDQYQPAGLILMEDNIPKDLSKLSIITSDIQKQTAKYPFLIMTDEEGCTVKRIPTDNYPCPKELGKEPIADTARAYHYRSELLAEYGINMNLGIVADTTDNPQSFIFPRSFGGDPQVVADHVTAAVKGTDDITLSTIKHFPGHGDTTADSHIIIPKINVSKKRWETYDKIPFQAGINAGANVVMTSHLIYSAIDPDNPASLSKTWIQILRNDMHFDGIIITDDMAMLQHAGGKRYQSALSNAIAAINAGDNLLLFVPHPGDKDTDQEMNLNQLIDQLVTAVQQGKIAQKTIDDSVSRVMQVRSELK